MSPAPDAQAPGNVVAVAARRGHHFSKTPGLFIDIVAGHGVAGDAHAGALVKHASRVAKNPDQPNLRQVHLIARELLDGLNREGFHLAPGDLGENITTSGLDLIALPRDTVLAIGDGVRLKVTGLRNPCRQIETFRAGLLSRMVGRHPDGEPLYRTGIMTIALSDGSVRPADPIRVELPPPPHRRLELV